MIEAYTLYSGSSGNSVLVRAGGDVILFDCGKTASALCRAVSDVGCSMADVRAIFVTHEHSDHISALDVLTRRYCIPVHITAPSLDAVGGAAFRTAAVAHPPLYSTSVGAMTVRSFLTHHDSAASVGYTVDFECDETLRLGIMTDTGCVTDDMTDALSGCTHVILESNHDVGMLMHGSYPFFLKERILSDRGHLSNDAAASFAVTLAKDGARSFTLAHISRENNTPETALRTVSDALGRAGAECALSTASPDRPVEVFSVCTASI